MSTTVESKTPVRRRWLRLVVCWLRIAAISYLGVVLVFLFLENSFVYFPSSANDYWKTPTIDGCQDVHLQTTDGTRVHGWWCPVKGSNGALLFCHGNGGNLSHWHDIIPGLQEELGVSVLIFDYPGYGRSEGRPSEAGCYASAESAYQWLTETQKIPSARVILCGISLGGGVAVDMAARHPHRALILINTFASLPDVGQAQYYWLPIRWAMRNRFDSLSKIGKCAGPIFISHGTRDGVIPFGLAERLYAAANEPKLLFAVENGDHDTLPPHEFYQQIRRSLDQKTAGTKK